MAVVEIRWGPAMVDVAAYIGAGAVLPLEDDVGRNLVYDVPLPSTDKPVPKRKESRRRRLARHGQWLRSGGRYLDIGQYYIPEPKPCGLVYLLEQKG